MGSEILVVLTNIRLDSGSFRVEEKSYGTFLKDTGNVHS